MAGAEPAAGGRGWTLPVVVVVVAAVLGAAVVAVLAHGRGGRHATPRVTATSRAPAGPPVRAMVYLCLEGECPDGTATEPDRRAVGDALRRTRGVVDVAYLDEQQAYERFRRLFADQPELVEAVLPGDLPAFFEFTACDPAVFPALERRLRGMHGVDTVQRVLTEEELERLPPHLTPTPPAGCGGGPRDG